MSLSRPGFFALLFALAACGRERSTTPTPYFPENHDPGASGGASSGSAGSTGQATGSTSAGSTGSTSAGSTGSTSAGSTGSTSAGSTGSTSAGSTGTDSAGASSGSSAGSTGSATGGSTGVVFDPRTWQPPGRGLWIWRFDYLNMTAEQVAARAQALGVSYVLIKSGQDANFWSTRYTAAAVASFTSRGIHVFAWPYITPTNVATAAAAAALAAKVPGTDGVILDVEIEFSKTSGADHSAAAAQLCDAIRSNAPGVFLGYTSFGWVGSHSDFPYTAFDQHCGDAFFPQVYWSDFGTTWSNGYATAVSGITKAKLTAPVWMAQSNDSGKNGVPVAADLNSFFAKAGARTSLWALTAATTSQYTQLPTLTWTDTAPNLMTWPAQFAPEVSPLLVAAPVDFSSAEATFATQLSLLRTHAVDEDLLALFTQSVTNDVPLSLATLSDCAARVANAAIIPDWEMAERSNAAVQVSIFGKSLTDFVKDSGGTFRATSLWCTPRS